MIKKHKESNHYEWGFINMKSEEGLLEEYSLKCNN